MKSIIPKDFKKGYKKGKEPKAKTRILAMHMFYVHNINMQKISDSTIMSQLVTQEIERFEKDDIP